MDTGDPVLVESDGEVGTVTLNRPAAMNAVTTELARRLESSLRALAVEVRVIVIKGARGNFSVGGDIHELRRLSERGEGALAVLFDSFGRACAAIAELPCPVVAAVEGHALAGGFELMQSCDLAVVSRTARLGDHHARFGMVPGGGGTQRLPRLIGRQRALGLLLTGDALDPAQAVEWGLAHSCVEPGDLDQAVAELAARLAAADPRAQATTKRLVYGGLAGPLADGLERERRAVVDHLSHQDTMSRFKQLKEN